MSLNALVRLPLSSSTRTQEDGLVKHSLFSIRTAQKCQQNQRGQTLLVVKAKGKRGMQARQFKRPPPPPLPKIEDDGNPKFVIFIRMANVCSFNSLSFVSSFLGKKLGFFVPMKLKVWVFMERWAMELANSDSSNAVAIPLVGFLQIVYSVKFIVIWQGGFWRLLCSSYD